MKSRKKSIITLSTLLVYLMLPGYVYSHCQVPCGIYDDEMRIKMINEHITTIEKAMKQISLLSRENSINFNQIVRWVNNKENHAQEIIKIISNYFMAQRIKPVNQNDGKKHFQYTERLKILHQLLVFSMRAKQTTDLTIIEKLRSITDKFKILYFNKTQISPKKN